MTDTGDRYENCGIIYRNDLVAGTGGRRCFHRHAGPALKGLTTVKMVVDVNVGNPDLLLRRIEFIDETYMPVTSLTELATDHETGIPISPDA